MSNRMAVILAAGKGTRMKSSLIKVLHPICGRPMVEHVLKAAQSTQANDIVVVVGNDAEKVQEALSDQCVYAHQAEQLGTGHAVLQAEPHLKDKKGNTLVVFGDTPLLTGETLSQMFDYHEQSDSHMTVLTAHLENPFGYGRIIRSQEGEVLKIVEQKDATEQERAVQEVNTGTFIFDNQKLFEALNQITNDNAQGEYYLTDVLEILQRGGGKISAFPLENIEESQGVNDRVALFKATQRMQRRINERHMMNGVTLINSDATYIDSDVIIGEDTVIEPGVSLKGNTVIGKGCYIGMNSEIVSSEIAEGVQLSHSVIEHSVIHSGVTIGPYAHIRPNSTLHQDVHIGNFVEVKNSTVGSGTKAGHLTYVGDADLGENINIGCGTIFVNFDGVNKHRSTVGNDVFIGCNANIVSPVEIEDRAFIAAGTTVTDTVEAESLAISRVKQTNIPNYWEKLQSKK